MSIPSNFITCGTYSFCREFTHFIKGGSDQGQQVLFDRVGFVECKPEKDREFFRQVSVSHFL